jgi:hypothetical protein
VERMTIGEFSKRSRLSAKALRLYDELGLLLPAEVDPSSGYRLYAPPVMCEVSTRKIPDRTVLCLTRNVQGDAGAWAFGKEFISLIRACVAVAAFVDCQPWCTAERPRRSDHLPRQASHHRNERPDCNFAVPFA